MGGHRSDQYRQRYFIELSSVLWEVIDQINTDNDTSRRTCLNSPDFFSYICGSFTISSQRTNIGTFVKKTYSAYFTIKLGDQGNAWAPQKVCKQCVESLRMWTKETHDLPFGIPMVWQEKKIIAQTLTFV